MSNRRSSADPLGPKQRKPQQKNTNPFDDDDNPKPPLYARISGGGSNPFGGDGGGSNPFDDTAPRETRGESKNPFGESTAAETRKNSKAAPSRMKTGPLNPFDEPSPSSLRKNPFGDIPPESTPSSPRGRKVPQASYQNYSGGPVDPFESKAVSSQPDRQSHFTDNPNSNNPFDFDVEFPSGENTMKGSHARHKSLNFVRRQPRAVYNKLFKKKKGTDDDSSSQNGLPLNHFDGIEDSDDDISHHSASSQTKKGRRHRRARTELLSSAFAKTAAIVRSSTSSSNASSSSHPLTARPSKAAADVLATSERTTASLKDQPRANKAFDDTNEKTEPSDSTGSKFREISAHSSSRSVEGLGQDGSAVASRPVSSVKRRVTPLRRFGRGKVNSNDESHQQEENKYERIGEQRSASQSDVVDGNEDDDWVGFSFGSDHEKKKNAPSDATAPADIERPEELPSIQEAVENLSIIEFERKAQERAVGIISNWLFDAGIVDELLVNGAAKHVPTSSGRVIGAGGSVGGSSVKTSEGVEIGANGFPILGSEGFMKMGKEIEKLRASAQRELGIINVRLNDGVVASDTELQEIIPSVATNRGDLGHLRELTTYISQGYRLVGRHPCNDDNQSNCDEFLFADSPRLKTAINARSNFFMCFRELEFFDQIPATCTRLRGELQRAADEWAIVRNVCVEHVELEILLVEAEVGMKTRVDHGGQNMGGLGKREEPNSMLPSSAQVNHEAVDQFLSTYAKNVWELGDEIRKKILSGIASAIELATNNPAGMMALVEAVEVYEGASQQYKTLHEGESENFSGNRTLNFTDMRAESLAHIYQDFESQGSEFFHGLDVPATDAVGDDAEAPVPLFTLILHSATKLVAEIDRVKNYVAPCFPSRWAVELVWGSCTAQICYNQILQQIGGPDGQNLPSLTITDLLDLVEWVENFRETMEEYFPVIASMHSKTTYFDPRPDLISGEGKKEVNTNSATETLAWINNMLWEVHRLAQEEFLVRTRNQTEEWLDKVYRAEHSKNMTSEGRLTTSLCEDVFSLATVQLRTIRERLTHKSDALVMAVSLVFSMLRFKQIHSRDDFLQDLETCCAASNDFQRMSERCEEMMEELLDECDFPAESVETLEASSSELLALYSSDAAYAAQCTHIYVFEPIADVVRATLFSPEWETNMTQNEVALTFIRTLEDFMTDLEQFMEGFMLKKAVDSLVSRSVIFYIKSLLLKAEAHDSNKVPYFNDNAKALERMSGDIQTMRDYFDGLVPQFRALDKVIENEFKILTAVHECMAIAAEISVSDAADFILVLHKRLKDIDITKHVVGDLWHLVNPTQERAVWELVESMETELLAMAPNDESGVNSAEDRMKVPGLRLNDMMADLYVESKRRRPVKASAMEKITKWRKKWKSRRKGFPRS